MIRVVVPTYIKKGTKEEFFQTAKTLIELSRKEKGCIEYNLVDSTEPDKLYFIEKWQTQNDLNVHMQTEHFKKYVPMLDNLKSKMSDAEVYETDK